MNYELLLSEASNPLYASEQEYPYPLTFPVRDSTGFVSWFWLWQRAFPRNCIPSGAVQLAGRVPTAISVPFRHAVDFLVPDGTVVYAADEGRGDYQDRFWIVGPT